MRGTRFDTSITVILSNQQTFYRRRTTVRQSYWYAFLVSMAVFSTCLFAQIPNKLSYQGLLTGASDGSYTLKFDLYNAPTDGTLRHTETFSGVNVTRGTFSVILGSTTPLPAIFSDSLYVQVTATAGPAGPTYPLTFSPRAALTSSPYSLAPWATHANGISYGDSSGPNVGIGTVPDAGVVGYRLTLQGINGSLLQLKSGVNRTAIKMIDSGPDPVSLTTELGSFNIVTGSGTRMTVATNGMVGIGTTTPSQNVEISALGGPAIRMNRPGIGSTDLMWDGLRLGITQGNVGIGTINPDNKFEVNQTTPANYAARIYTTGLGDGLSYGLNISAGTNGSDVALKVRNQAGWDLLTVLGNGRVGIGTTPDPGYTYNLEVGGYTHIVAGLDIDGDLSTGGYTHLGLGSPAIQMTKITGTYHFGASNVIRLADSNSRLLGVSIFISGYPPNYGATGYEYNYFLSAGSIHISPDASDLDGGPITILVIFTE